MFNTFDLPFANEYLLGYPFKKILPIIFFVFNQLVFLFVAFLVWFVSFGLTIKAYLYSILAVLATTLMIIIFTLTYSFWIIEYDHDVEKNQHDYGIILGAAVWSGNKPSPIFIGRIEKGAKLFKQKAIKKIQLTGGNAPGELSEAKTAYNYLREKYNLDSNQILIEEKTSTTNEQIRYIKNNFVNDMSASDFIFISDEFHLMRIKEMADFYGLKAKVVSSEYKLNLQKSLFYRLRDSIGLILFWFFGV
ncbi:MAG: YdcF family protein [Melioribacteraceae bacterium]|nr:YdcF family protein [Melioribacteraceae bacterium]